LTRVMLLRSEPTTPAAIVLTVADVIIDGLSAGYVLRSALRCCGVHPRRLLCLGGANRTRAGCIRRASGALLTGRDSDSRPNDL
jgi:hypothetical protein